MFGGTNGFNIFLPEKVKENTKKPPVYINSFKLFNKEVAIGEDEILKTHIMLTKHIVLKYYENIFSFEFVALNFRQPEKNQYRYKMEGFDEDWVDAGIDRKKEYTNLSPGKYTFKVMASNNDGVWNEEGASVSITIIPPFWKTWWFTIALILIVIYSVVWYVRHQKKKAKRQQEELTAIIEERTHELREQNEEMVKKAERERVYNWITQGLALVGETISKNTHDLNALSSATLDCVVKYVQAQQGLLAIGIKETGEDEYLEVLATYGIAMEQLTQKRIDVGAGMLGETYRDKEKKILDKLPANYIKIRSGLGEALPVNVVLLPLPTEDREVVGVIELAFLGTISDEVNQFLDKVCKVIALNIFAAMLNQKTKVLLQQSKEQTEEMQAQEEEMRQNMEELAATTEEFQRREIEYQQRIKELEGKLHPYS
jgi:DNA-binding transcriptional MerR regulator